MNICGVCHFTVRVPVLSISSCVCFYVSVPGLSMNICGSVSFYSCSSSQHQFLLCFYLSVPGLTYEYLCECVILLFCCSEHQLCLFYVKCSRIKYEYLCECVILLFVFQFSASVHCVCFYVSVPGLSMNICVSVSFYCSWNQHKNSASVLVCFYVVVPGLQYEYLCECAILLFVFQLSASVC